MNVKRRSKDFSKELEELSAPELTELRRVIDRRLGTLQRTGGESLIERLSGSGPIDLVALVVKRTGIRCRTLDTRESVTLRPRQGVRHESSAQILTVEPRRAWAYGRTAYLSGEILAWRMDAAALGLTPLSLEKTGIWDPKIRPFGVLGCPASEFIRPLIAAGPRPSFKMEMVLPGLDPKDPDSDPVARAVELAESRGWGAAYQALEECLEQDLRALDAHAHLGEWKFGAGDSEWCVKDALPHYEAGVAIGDLSIGAKFVGVLPGMAPENRPFLRCLRGMGLCKWALADFAGAQSILSRLLWLDPSDSNVLDLLGEVAGNKAFLDSQFLSL